MPLAEVVAHVEPGQEAGELGARSVEAQQVGDRVAQRLGPRVPSLEEGLGHHVPQDAGGGRVPLRVVAVEEAVG